MAYTTIDKPTDYFNTVLYTGNNSSSHSITGVGFQPDWVWIKPRNGTDGHVLTDSVRGALKRLRSEGTNAEDTLSGSLSSFDSDGFTVGNAGEVNSSSYNFVAWNWLASNTTASNTDGSITSTVSANTTAGFSIATWTTPSSGTVFDVGHGLGGKPDMMIMKSRGSTGSWWTWHIGLGDNTTDYLSLNSTNAEQTLSGMWGTVGAGTSTFGYTAGTSAPTSTTTVAYFFKSIKGYSKFGSYTGNGNADGTFVYTGFKPAWVMIKRSSASGNNWFMYDNKRDPFNPTDLYLPANDNGPDATFLAFDILSNGIKLKTTNTGFNNSGDTYIYMMFAENPFVSSSGIPTTAR